MSTANVTIDALRAGISLATGKTHTLILKRIPAQFLELDVGFGLNSALLLPDLVPPSKVRPRRENSASIFEVLREVFYFAEQNASSKLLIVGHTDTSGDRTCNAELSERRARHVHALLGGDGDAWATLCSERHDPEDVQRMLRWAAREHGCASHPGKLDGVYGPRTRAALWRFREHRNRESATKLDLTAPIGLDD